jgi:hypothetical protein
VVPELSPEIACENATGLDPAPSEAPPAPRGARVPKLSSQAPGFTVSYRNQPVAASSFGLAEPFSVAPVAVITVAAEVVTTGAPGVVNESTEPKPVPTALSAIAQK